MAEAATQLRPELVPQRTVIPVINPATTQKIADVPVTDADGVEAAVRLVRAIDSLSRSRKTHSSSRRSMAVLHVVL